MPRLSEVTGGPARRAKPASWQAMYAAAAGWAAATGEIKQKGGGA